MGSPPQNQKTGKYKVIHTPADLQKKALVPGNFGASDMAAIERAEKAMEALSQHFDSWMNSEIESLEKARENLRIEGITKAAVDGLFTVAHDIKGQGVTLGYPMASVLAAQLCDLIVRIPDIKKLHPVLIDQHVDSIKAIVREGVKDAEDRRANAISQRLYMVTKDYLNQVS